MINVGDDLNVNLDLVTEYKYVVTFKQILRLNFGNNYVLIEVYNADESTKGVRTKQVVSKILAYFKEHEL